MAILEHREILLSGREKWNQWRRDNPGIEPDLSHLNFYNINLSCSKIPSSTKEFNESLKKSPNYNDKHTGHNIQEFTRIYGYDLSYVNFENTVITNSNLVGVNLKNSNLSSTKFENTDLSWTNFRSVIANKSNFLRCEINNSNLEMSIFENSSFHNCNMKQSIFTLSNLKITLFNKVNLSRSSFVSANLSHSTLEHAKLQKTTFINSNLSNSNLMGANIKNADLRGANLNSTDVHLIKYNRKTLYRGIRVETTYGSPLFKRFAQDQDFIEEFRSTKFRRPIYFLWLIFSDCGKSISLWAFWSILLAILFGLKYYSLGAQAFDIAHLDWNYASTIYYSIVTFTTLGFGDIVPITIEAAYWVMGEVIVGYVMLGGLISILASKLARRS